MNIGLDYDGTYTRDPSLWNTLIAGAVEAGHSVFCVTSRYPEEPVEMPCETVYCSRRAKQAVINERSMRIDVWIDDNPYFIFGGAE